MFRIRIHMDEDARKEAKKATKRILGGIAAIILVGILIWFVWLKNEPLWEVVLKTAGAVLGISFALGVICLGLCLTPLRKYPLIRDLAGWAKRVLTDRGAGPPPF